jgi:putative ABC transport system ATP-binding protein
MDNGALVRLIDLHKVYRTGEMEVPAVRGVSLEIKRGEFVALMGASGSGKSTLMNILGCLDRPTTGHYILNGADVSGLDRDQLADIRNRKIGFVFQNFNLLPRTSARENVELPLVYSAQRLTNAELRERADRVLVSVGLSGREDHHPSQLSGGQQQRVAIARALINEPEVLLADEPTGNLDSRTSVEIMAIFQQLNERGITVVMVTHESDIAAYAKRNVMMRDGVILMITSFRGDWMQQRSFKNGKTGPPDAPDATSHDPARDQMRIGPTFNVAVRALRRNKLRSRADRAWHYHWRWRGHRDGWDRKWSEGPSGSADRQSRTKCVLIFSGSTTSSGIRTGWAAPAR